MATTSTKQSKTTEETEVAETPSAAQIVEQPQLTPVEDASMADSPVQAPVMITLSEFMIKLTQRDKRVELTNAFAFTERRAGHNKDFESEFQSRFVAFTQLVIED